MIAIMSRLRGFIARNAINLRWLSIYATKAWLRAWILRLQEVLLHLNQVVSWIMLCLV